MRFNKLSKAIVTGCKKGNGSSVIDVLFKMLEDGRPLLVQQIEELESGLVFKNPRQVGIGRRDSWRSNKNLSFVLQSSSVVYSAGQKKKGRGENGSEIAAHIGKEDDIGQSLRENKAIESNWGLWRCSCEGEEK